MKSNAEDKFETTLATISSGSNPRRRLANHDVAEGLFACFSNAGTLLDDAFLLATNNRLPRALSLTILALEELAKIPELDKQYIDPQARDDPAAWKRFWQTFIRHKSKQKTISEYGNLLRNVIGESAQNAENAAPYAHYLSETSFEYLDNIKQRQFYVDFVDSSFHCPSENKEVREALDKLFAFADERHKSFSSWYVSAQRSIDFLYSREALIKPLGNHRADHIRKHFSINDWATTNEIEEKRADLVHLLSIFSSSSVPDYDAFLPNAERLCEEWTKEEILSLFSQEGEILRDRMDQDILRLIQFRSGLAFKLLFAFGARHLDPPENKRIFGLEPSDEVIKHFQNC